MYNILSETTFFLKLSSYILIFAPKIRSVILSILQQKYLFVLFLVGIFIAWFNDYLAHRLGQLIPPCCWRSS